MIKRVSNSATGGMVEAPTYICSTSDFVVSTDAVDGSTLMVVDTSTHVINKYYIAFDGYWNEV